ncbi:Y' element ATP-dependent helicase YPR204W-like isoform X2 [Dendronephthya gigantea]|uniref:Y' element ATP-dependent helicase YPR204W-like isoform X2 n=1 Tax=Dendronephthya gigantea TaxID=151771 RepID=UPI00106B8BEC|nr:Y' element ATP-dependent helicase YPR204W-like isoform X2 [Dendronephthya gigantea]XP_028390660.1 Y' element ATP-dependent helicase YPR204W-like isoform X2 [Dendronephthya gigantea]XP_028390661.1 Y' element ATP-dependent helicase YPR204W-like isoform X2 [Dendronephthya gigantea]XP_028390662.1 Y' element ATP-dependent helicase YPR204W-like isoform X2 [Dendronephthya gigantea]
MNMDECERQTESEEDLTRMVSKVNTSRKKKCPFCNKLVGNACRRCFHCGSNFQQSKKKLKLPQGTNPSNQWDLLKKRVDTLHVNHEYDIIVMFHKSHARGDTWDCFGTPGFSTSLLSSKAGASLKNVFRLGILHEKTNIKEDSNSSTNINLTCNTSTNTAHIHTNVNPVTNADADILTNLDTNVQPRDSTDITDANNETNSNTIINIGFNSNSNTNTNDNSKANSNTKSNTNLNTDETNLSTTTNTHSSSNVSTNCSTNSSTNTNTSVTTNNIARHNINADVNTESKRKNVVLITAGTKVGLVDSNKCVQAWGVVHSQKTVHGKPLKHGHVVIEIKEILPTCQLKPPCPGTFDDPDRIHIGEFHSWPLTSVALPLKPGSHFS